MLGPCAKPFHNPPPPQILEVLLLVASCHRNPNLYLFFLLNKLASVLSFMGCSVPLLPLTLPQKKIKKRGEYVWQPPFLPSPLLHSYYELFKSKIKNLAEAATIMQRGALGLRVLRIQQIGEEAEPRQRATGKITQLESQMLQWQTPNPNYLRWKLSNTSHDTFHLLRSPASALSISLHLSSAILKPLVRGQPWEDVSKL